MQDKNHPQFTSQAPYSHCTLRLHRMKNYTRAIGSTFFQWPKRPVDPWIHRCTEEEDLLALDEESPTVPTPDPGDAAKDEAKDVPKKQLDEKSLGQSGGVDGGNMLINHVGEKEEDEGRHPLSSSRCRKDSNRLHVVLILLKSQEQRQVAGRFWCSSTSSCCVCF